MDTAMQSLTQTASAVALTTAEAKIRATEAAQSLQLVATLRTAGEIPRAMSEVRL